MTIPLQTVTFWRCLHYACNAGGANKHEAKHHAQHNHGHQVDYTERYIKKGPTLRQDDQQPS